MSSSSPASLPPSKGTTFAPPLSPLQSQAPGSTPNWDRQRRSAASSSSATTARGTMSSPRSNQALRKQNKASRRPKLGGDDSVELNALRSMSSRKGQTSITHLMNFTLPPRQHHFSHNHATRGHLSGRRGYSWGYNAVDKARYIHANYRFIVNPQGGYESLHSVDDHIDWKDVLQVLASAQSQSASCPICLSTPIAPRMAKCGHIFCLPCLIRYMHSADETNPLPERKARWKRCPICEDSIFISETRPVRWFVGQEGESPREGFDVVLRLMERSSDSSLALPRECADSSTLNGGIPWYFAAEVMDYARVMKGSEDYMQSQYDREIGEIEYQEREDELLFGEETLWTQKALKAIRDAKERLQGMGNPPSDLSQRLRERASPRKSVLASDDGDAVLTDQHSTSAQFQSYSISNGHPQEFRGELSSPRKALERSNTLVQFGSNNHRLANPKTAPRGVGSSSAVTFHFYHALLHYYLAPLDIRILRAAFGDYSLFPSTILPRVEHVSTGHVIDDELRKRAKYLAHLPQGCEVGFLECDWTDIVPEEILEKFAIEIERRRKRNKEKEVREEKERLRAEKEEDEKRWAAVRRRRPSVSDESREIASAEPSEPPKEPDLTDLAAPSASPPWSHRRTGFASLASPSTSPSTARTVWGTAAIQATESPPLKATRVVEEPESDGWLQGWEADLLREEDLISQVKATSIGESSTSAATGKKKKQKKITLMTTNGRRAA